MSTPFLLFRRFIMDKINKFLKKIFIENGDVTYRLVCKDGFKISIGASVFHHCDPCKNKAWPYKSVQLNFPSELDDLIGDYAQDPKEMGNVYSYVPIDIVNELIEKHGGIVE